MGRGVLRHPGALATARVNWEDDFTSMCFYCDEEVTFDGEHYIIEGNDVPEHCAMRYAELVQAPNGDVYYAMENAFHSGWQYDADNFAEDLRCTAEYMIELWPSLYEIERWIGNEVHIFLENSLVEFSVSEYCGTVEISISPKESAIDAGQEGLAKRWIASVESKFMKIFNH